VNGLLPIGVSSDSNTINYISVNSYQSLQEIIDTARPYSTILLDNGVYREPLSINKPLTLLGKNQYSTVLSIETNPNNAAITLKSENIVLSNLTISNIAEGIYTTALRVNAPNCTIQNCTFKDTPIGIAVWSSNTLISHSSFFNCSDEGLLLISTSISNSNYNKIHHCNFQNNCDAIELQQSSHNSIKHCTMNKNTHSGIDAICKNNNYNQIENCTIMNNEVHGIYFSSSQQNIIKNCYFFNNSENNVVFTHDSRENTLIEIKEETSPSIVDSLRSNEYSSQSNFSLLSPTELDSPSQEDMRLFQRIFDIINYVKENILNLQNPFKFF
jgi:parallel beta-helix repeat protein